MSPELQRVEIAKACGWTITETEYFRQLTSPDGSKGLCCGKHISDKEVFESGIDEHGNIGLRIPDYLNDLNAMREAVLSQSDRFQRNFCEQLKRMTETDGGDMWDDYVTLCMASAAQWAEAFLKAHKKLNPATPHPVDGLGGKGEERKTTK